MVTLHAYSGLTGAHLARLPSSSVSWSDSINEPGSLTATLPDTVDAGRCLRAYGTVLAAIEDGMVLHAGYVAHAKMSGGLWSVDCGGGSTVLEKRLVLNHALASSWKDGYVLIDEDHPSGNWPLALRGSYSDIVSKLISETLKWGALPIVPATLTGGSHERNYNSYDLATVLSRISDIGDLEDGPEIRFDPVVGSDGSLKFHQRTSDEIRDNWWRWNAVVPLSPVEVGDEDCDGGDMCTQCFASGGKDEDKLLVARAVSGELTAAGWPVLQAADTSHSSVSELPTLKSYASAAVGAGDEPQRTRGLKVRRDVPVRVGDWADVRTGEGLLELKVTDVSGSAGSSMLTVQCRPRR